MWGGRKVVDVTYSVGLFPLNFFSETRKIQVKLKLNIHITCITCATYHSFFSSLDSFDSAFSSKEGVPLHATHFQVLASYSQEESETF